MAISVLVVEDDRNISDLLHLYLEKEGYAVTTAFDGGEGLNKFRAIKPDLVLLDVMMPVMDGWSVCKAIRAEGKTPVIMLTAKSETDDKVQGLKSGADDYITKPFGTSELLARIRTAIRHTRMAGSNPSVAKENRFKAMGLVIDYDKYRVYVDDRDAGLTQNEFKLVALLGRYAGRVLTYDYLLREIWGPNKAYDNQILRVNMANIRRKIEKNPAEPQYIFTEVGVGYRMVEGD